MRISSIWNLALPSSFRLRCNLRWVGSSRRATQPSNLLGSVKLGSLRRPWRGPSVSDGGDDAPCYFDEGWPRRPRRHRVAGPIDGASGSRTLSLRGYPVGLSALSVRAGDRPRLACFQGDNRGAPQHLCLLGMVCKPEVIDVVGWIVVGSPKS
jgi:hypothetical protein